MWTTSTTIAIPHLKPLPYYQMATTYWAAHPNRHTSPTTIHLSHPNPCSSLNISFTTPHMRPLPCYSTEVPNTATTPTARPHCQTVAVGTLATILAPAAAAFEGSGTGPWDGFLHPYLAPTMSSTAAFDAAEWTSRVDLKGGRGRLLVARRSCESRTLAQVRAWRTG